MSGVFTLVAALFLVFAWPIIALMLLMAGPRTVTTTDKKGVKSTKSVNTSGYYIGMVMIILWCLGLMGAAAAFS